MVGMDKANAPFGVHDYVACIGRGLFVSAMLHDQDFPSSFMIISSTS
jgi:hypothetical protein